MEIEYKYLPDENISSPGLAGKYLLPLYYIYFLSGRQTERGRCEQFQVLLFYYFIVSRQGDLFPHSHRATVKNQIENHYQDRISSLFLLPTPLVSRRVSPKGSYCRSVLHIRTLLSVREGAQCWCHRSLLESERNGRLSCTVSQTVQRRGMPSLSVVLSDGISLI